MAKSKVNSPSTAIGVAWYRPDQWETLRNVSVDRDKLENTYSEWLVEAERVVKQLQQRGLRVVKVDVEISELMLWCESQRIPLDGEARSNYAAFKLHQLAK
jgi:hypothetical protein